MITAMNWGGDAPNRALLKAKDIEMFAKPKPKNTRAEENHILLRVYVNFKATKKPRKKIVRKKKAKR